MQTLRSLAGAADWLLNHVEEHYQRTYRPVLLSELGNSFKVEFGLKIAELPTLFRQEFERFGIPDQPGAASVIRLLLPRKVEVLAPDGNYARAIVKPLNFVGSKSAGNPASESDARVIPRKPAEFVRYVRALWTAFIRPLDDNQYRLFWDTWPFEYRDLNNGDSPSRTGGIAIERRYIIGLRPDEKPDFAVVKAKIEEWAREKQIDTEKLYDRKSEAAEKAKLIERLGGATSATSNSAASLRMFLESLPPELARRIDLPGDIVAFILKQDVSQ